jgi:hypothetical protein
VRHIVMPLAVVLVLSVGCSEGASDDGTLRLTFDGDGCEYEGPTQISPGPVILDFVNESDDVAAANMIRLDDGYTIQDVIEYNGPEPSQKHAPSWSQDVSGVWEVIVSGETHRWEGDLEQGTYFVVCAGMLPFGVWNGAGLEVEG